MQLEGESVALAGDQWQATLPAKIASVEDYPRADVRWPGVLLLGRSDHLRRHAICESGYGLWGALPGNALLAFSVTDD